MQKNDFCSSVAAHAWITNVMGLATSFYERLLWSSPPAAQARALLRSRRISDQTARLSGSGLLLLVGKGCTDTWQAKAFLLPPSSSSA